jgi:MFS family permease
VARYGRHRILRTVGTLRAIWLIGLAVVQPGVAGLATVIAVEFAIIVSMSLYNPVLATYRLEHTPDDRIARTLAAWSISSSAAIAVLSALGGLLAEATSARTALTVAGLLILASPLLLPRRPAPGAVPRRRQAADPVPPRTPAEVPTDPALPDDVLVWPATRPAES